MSLNAKYQEMLRSSKEDSTKRKIEKQQLEVILREKDGEIGDLERKLDSNARSKKEMKENFKELENLLKESEV
jgi:hypothetical protein